MEVLVLQPEKYKSNNTDIGKSEMHKRNIYEQLLNLCSPVIFPPPPYDLWVKTRDIADKCNISIYSARLYLLELESDGKIMCSHQIVNNSLRWYPKMQF
ncbi:FaeA/PapI family transcriptional regulator [Enterobacter roggenkampii]|uniref:FaeA/PapI family transcriptional regulator n=2 Tax=Enterobacter roggenkampii TaxID=1812935 RepID=UPI00345E5414